MKNFIINYDSVFYLKPNEIKRRENLYYTQLINNLGLKRKKCLDFGCGTGFWLNLYDQLGAIVYGVDINSELIELTKSKHSFAQLLTWSNNKLPFDDDTFDFVFSTWVLQSIDDDEIFKTVLFEIKRVLKTNGKFVISYNIYPDARKLLFETQYGCIFQHTKEELNPQRFIKSNSMDVILKDFNFFQIKTDIVGHSFFEVFNNLKRR